MFKGNNIKSQFRNNPKETLFRKFLKSVSFYDSIFLFCDFFQILFQKSIRAFSFYYVVEIKIIKL